MQLKQDYAALLQGGDLRSIGAANALVDEINSQEKFDALVELLFHDDRKVAMRAADAIEKVTLNQPEFLKPHKQKILLLISNAQHIELKWHLAQLAPRVDWAKSELSKVADALVRWCLDSGESKIVRVNALQSLHNLASTNPHLQNKLKPTVAQLKAENIPSINARLRKLKL